MKCFLRLLAIVFLIQVTQGAFVNLFCPRSPPAADKNETLVFTCNEDCILQHGAFGGTCGDASKGDYNCYCGPLSGKRNERSIQCIQPHQERYNEICNIDCLCNQGGTGGYCNWDLKACVCTGFNPTNVNCPMKTVEEFAWFVYTKSGRADLGPFGLATVRKIIPIP